MKLIHTWAQWMFHLFSALNPDKWIGFKLQDTARVSHNSHLFRYIFLAQLFFVFVLYSSWIELIIINTVCSAQCFTIWDQSDLCRIWGFPCIIILKVNPFECYHVSSVNFILFIQNSLFSQKWQVFIWSICQVGFGCCFMHPYKVCSAVYIDGAWCWTAKDFLEEFEFQNSEGVLDRS